MLTTCGAFADETLLPVLDPKHGIMVVKGGLTGGDRRGRNSVSLYLGDTRSLSP